MRETDLSSAGAPRASAGRDTTDAGRQPDGFRAALSGDRRRVIRPDLGGLEDDVRATGVPQPGAGPVSGGGKRASGAGGADGCALGPAGGSGAARGPRFDEPVSRGGYAWWYCDGLSDDGQYGITVIAFIGSVFSPYFAWAQGRSPGGADPLSYCAINVALYRLGGKSRWSMTERSRASVTRTATSLAIGPSAFEWHADALSIRVDERCSPIPRRLRGRIDLWPTALCDHDERLDPGGFHRWRPIAPSARLQVRMDDPALRWSGDAYFDSNAGTEPLAHAFRGWEWSRSRLAGGDVVVLYEVDPRGGASRCVALRFDRHGQGEAFDPPPRQSMARTRWGLQRVTRSDAEHAPGIVRTLEDTPFYSRSIIASRLLDEPVVGVHESLSLDRFRSTWVRCLLPFRMPRRG